MFISSFFGFPEDGAYQDIKYVAYIHLGINSYT